MVLLNSTCPSTAHDNPLIILLALLSRPGYTECPSPQSLQNSLLRRAGLLQDGGVTIPESSPPDVGLGPGMGLWVIWSE